MNASRCHIPINIIRVEVNLEEVERATPPNLDYPSENREMWYYVKTNSSELTSKYDDDVMDR